MDTTIEQATAQQEEQNEDKPQAMEQEEWWRSEDSNSEDSGGNDTDDEAEANVGPPDPLYDSGADDEDEAWVDKQRSGRVSDAILNCPGCFTTLCIDCQKHEIHHNQFRAMFVMNCEVRTDHVVHATSTGGSSKRRRDGDEQAAEQHKMLSVACSTCGTEVGCMDEDEVYHFHNVFPSNA